MTRSKSHKTFLVKSWNYMSTKLLSKIYLKINSWFTLIFYLRHSLWDNSTSNQDSLVAKQMIRRSTVIALLTSKASLPKQGDICSANKIRTKKLDLNFGTLNSEIVPLIFDPWRSYLSCYMLSDCNVPKLRIMFRYLEKRVGTMV